MSITEGKIVLESADLAQLPPLIQAAIASLAGGTSPEVWLSAVFNAALDSYAAQFIDAKVLQLRELGLALIATPSDVKPQVQSLMDQATALLGLSNIPL